MEKVDSVNMVVIMKKAVGSSILCVIDFSEASKDAFKTAFSIADSTKSSLTVVYPYRLNQPKNVPSMSEWKRSLEIDASSSFNRMTSNMLKNSSVVCEFKPEVGFVNDRIEAFTEKNDVRVVVLSAELARTSDGAFLNMLPNLRCPLLIVPKTQKIEI